MVLFSFLTLSLLHLNAEQGKELGVLEELLVVGSKLECCMEAQIPLVKS